MILRPFIICMLSLCIFGMVYTGDNKRMTQQMWFSTLLRGEFKSVMQPLHTTQRFSEYTRNSTIPLRCI